MNEQEWIEQAKKYERMAQEAYDEGDEIAGWLYQGKAEACRFAACYGTVKEEIK